jgi:hypothetical protein
MLFKFSDLLFQNVNSVVGPGSFPYLRAISGSNLSTFLIYLVHVIIELSKICALSLSGVLSVVVSLLDGIGNIVLPLINPNIT